MIPNAYVPEIMAADLADVTWRLLEDWENVEDERIAGLSAVRQAVWLILHTERCRYPIFSWNYGIELEDLFGEPISFVRPEVERRITDALMVDDRITDVNSFSFERIRNKLLCRFTVHTIFGNFRGERFV